LAWQVQRNPDWISLRRAGKLPFAVTGFAWAARRDAFPDGLYDRLICGNGDAFLADSYFGSFGLHHYASKWTSGMSADARGWLEKFRRRGAVRVSNLPGDVYHLWHGHVADRQYRSRDDILLAHDFDPRTDVTLSEGVYEWSSDKPQLHAEIRAYFDRRREDER
jgi:hypothetical protein